MGDSRSKYYDDLNDYNEFCKVLQIKPQEEFYSHQRELLNGLGFEILYDYYENVRLIEKRNEKINQILD